MTDEVNNHGMRTAFFLVNFKFFSHKPEPHANFGPHEYIS